MEFKQVTLNSQSLEAQKHFYQKVLGFETTEQDDCLSLQAGSTELVFKQSTAPNNCYHFAFLICDAHFDACKKFLKNKGVPLLPNSHTGDEVTYWENETGRSVYFFDGDGNIAEFISRPTLGFETTAPWSINQVLKVNEIGTPVTDPLQTSQQLLETSGLHVPKIYRDSFNERFCWFGDFHATLLIAKQGRHWFPTAIAARYGDVALHIVEGNRQLSLSFTNGAFQ